MLKKEKSKKPNPAENKSGNDKFNRPFSTVMNGFKKSEVNLYINELKKRINILESEKLDLTEKLQALSTPSEETQVSLPQYTTDYAKQISDLNDELWSERETTAKLKAEITNLQQGEAVPLKNIISDELNSLILNLQNIQKKLENENPNTDFMVEFNDMMVPKGNDLQFSDFESNEDSFLLSDTALEEGADPQPKELLSDYDNDGMSTKNDLTGFYL